MKVPYVTDFVALCMKQRGDQYVFGAETSFSDPDPERFDCSELVEWACRRLGVQMVDGSYNQKLFVQRSGLLTTIDAAIKTPGALLFRTPGKPGHVAVSRGDGTTIEARGRAYGVNVFSAYNRSWTHGGRIPNFIYGAAPKPPVPNTGTKPPVTATAPAFDHPHKNAKGNVFFIAPHYDCDWVKKWQGRMKARGWGITVDGDYGPASREICEQFQENKNLTVDGIVGPVTWRAAWEMPIT